MTDMLYWVFILSKFFVWDLPWYLLTSWWLWILIGWITVVPSFVMLMLTSISCSGVAFPQNLKKKYNAEWAVVTGGSSGIGKELVMQLAEQGLNVIIAAMDDSLLRDTHALVKRKFPDQEFVAVGVDLSEERGGRGSGSDVPLRDAAADVLSVQPAYMDKLRQATTGLKVQLVFCNAGYMKTGFFAEASIDVLIANHHCNCTSAVRIAHHFASAMRTAGLKGAIVLTSSPAGMMACPFSAIYGASKAYLTEFAVSIAPELRPDGIDVTVVHPSPTDSLFYQGTHKLAALQFFKSTAISPSSVATVMLSSVGRVVVREQGWFSNLLCLGLRVVDPLVMAEIITRGFASMPDYKLAKAGQVMLNPTEKKKPL